MRVDAIVLNLAVVDGFYVEGVAEHEGDAFVRAQIGNQYQMKMTLDGDHEVIAIGSHSDEERLGPCLHVAVQRTLLSASRMPRYIERAREIDAAVVLMGLGVESH
jgi:3-deoxy-D-manno-octulosonic-acid transferase